MPYKILHIIDSLGCGGTELQLVLNAVELQGEQFQNYVCYLHAPNDLGPALSSEGIPVYGLGLTGSYQWAQGVWRLRKLAKSLEIDLIHTNLFEADVVGALTGRFINRPVISTVASICFEPALLLDNPHMSRVKMAAPRAIRSFIARTCNTHLIAVSQSVAQSAIRRLGASPRKTSVIYRALAHRWLEPDEEGRLHRLRDELGLSEAAPVILNVGRLIPPKGQRYLIAGMRTVLQRLPQAKLLIVGDGPLKSSLIELRDEMGLQGDIFFLGHRDDIKELLGVSDIFAFPSLFEGCPNALIEALAMGKPCVASQIGPIQEVIEHGFTGLLVPPQSPEALADGIIRLASGQEEASSMGRRARTMALERFTVETAVQRLQALYERVLREYYGAQSDKLAKPTSHIGAGK